MRFTRRRASSSWGCCANCRRSARAHLVVGHNPGMGDVANLLAGEGPASERLRLASKFPTASLAVIAFDRPDWSDLRAGAGRLEKFVTPADL